MHILFLSHYFPPEGNAPASRTYEHCRRWAEAGYDVTVITCVPNVPHGRPYQGYRNRLWPQVEDVDGIRVVRVWTLLAANSGFVKRTLSFLSYMVSATFTLLFLRRPDVVIATSPQFFCGWAGVLGSVLKRCPFVLEIRDIWPESILTVGAMKKSIVIRFLEWLELVMYRSATHIVAVGNGYRDNIAAKLGSDEKISVITNGVDLEQFAPQIRDEAVLNKWQLGGRFVCSYVGTLGMAHALHVVIDAAKMLRDIDDRRFVFCLAGDGADRTRLETLAQQEDLGDFVTFTGLIPKTDVVPLLASSDAILVHLQKCDLFQTVLPSKIFEGMAMERPLVVGVEGEAAEIVQSAQAGLTFTPEDAEGLVACLRQLHDDPELAVRLGKNGRDAVCRHYNRDVLAAEMLEVVERVVRLRQGREASGEKREIC